MERSLFMEMLTTFAAMVHSYKIALFFFSPPSPFSPLLWRESEAFVEILLPNWPFHISKNIDSANGRGEKSFVQSTASQPPQRDFKFKFPCNRISRQKSRLIRPIERRTSYKVPAPIMNNSGHKFA